MGVLTNVINVEKYILKLAITWWWCEFFLMKESYKKGNQERPSVHNSMS